MTVFAYQLPILLIPEQSLVASIEKVIIGSSVTSIGDDAFSNCTGLTEISLQDGLVTIGANAMQNCSSLESVSLPDTVTDIGSGAFSNCVALSEVHLSDSLNTIGTDAFMGCSALTDVTYGRTKEEANMIQIGTGNEQLTAVTWHCAPSLPENLTTMTLPASLKTIEESAFEGVIAQQIVIPATVQRIDSRAFADCANLMVLYFEGAPANIADDILNGCGHEVVFSLPAGSPLAVWAGEHGIRVIYH